MGNEDIDQKIQDLANSGGLSERGGSAGILGTFKKQHKSPAKPTEEPALDLPEMMTGDIQCHDMAKIEERLDMISNFILKTEVGMSLPGFKPESWLKNLERDPGNNEIAIIIPTQTVLCRLDEINGILEYFKEHKIKWHDARNVSKQGKQND